MSARCMSSPNVLVLLALKIVIFTAVCTDGIRRAKRIAFAQDLRSNAIFNTQFYIEIKHNWGCLVDHDKHDFPSSECQGREMCGGSLIHPKFLATAAHCLVYTEYAIHFVGEEDPYEGASFWETITIFWDRLVEAVKTVFIVPKPKHTMYSDWLLLAGGTNDDEMTQIRHAHHIFPHPDFVSQIIYNNNTEGPKRSNLHSHDFMLVEACEAFRLDDRVGLAQLPPMTQMQAHYDHIVKLGLVCLYIGMGKLDKYQYVKLSRPPYNKAPFSNWTQFTWRASQCFSGCNNYREMEFYRFEHPCHLCSSSYGPHLNQILPGDSGSPVICEGKLTAVNSVTSWLPWYNVSWASSYAIHCSRNMITRAKLNYYMTLKTDPYHILVRRKHTVLG